MITKVNQFDSSLSCKEDVVAFHVTMDNPVVVQMLKTLKVRGQKRHDALNKSQSHY